MRGCFQRFGNRDHFVLAGKPLPERLSIADGILLV